MNAVTGRAFGTLSFGTSELFAARLGWRKEIFGETLLLYDLFIGALKA